MTDELSNVRAGYDRWAEVYDHDLNPLPPLEEPIVRQLVGDVRGLRALDLGAGTGRHSHWLAQAGARVTAVDFSTSMLEEARRKTVGLDVRFVVHDLHQPLPFDDSSFDLVVSGLVLEHLRDLKAFFDEVRRVLKPGARAVVSAMHPAMFLRQSQARFTDPRSGEVVPVGSRNHGFAPLVLAPIQARLLVEDLREAAPDEAFAKTFPRAAKYVDYPMLLAQSLRRDGE